MEVSATASPSERSSSLKSKTITLVLFNSTGTLQVQGPDTKAMKAKLKKLLQIPADDDSVILVNEEASTPAFNKNAKSVQEELECLKSEVLSLWAHIKEKPDEEDLRSENSRLREVILSLKEENKKLVQERDSLSLHCKSYPEKQLLNAVQ